MANQIASQFLALSASCVLNYLVSAIFVGFRQRSTQPTSLNLTDP